MWKKRALVKSHRKAPTPEREVRICDWKRGGEVQMDIIEQEKVVNNHLLASSN